MRKFYFVVLAFISLNSFGLNQSNVDSNSESQLDLVIKNPIKSVKSLEISDIQNTNKNNSQQPSVSMSQLMIKVPISVDLDKGLKKDFSSKYLSGQYLLSHREIIKSLNLYCDNHASINEKEIFNCNQAALYSNFWYKLYVYSGYILNQISFEWVAIIMLLIGVVLFFMSLKLFGYIMLTTKSVTSYIIFKLSKRGAK